MNKKMNSQDTYSNNGTIRAEEYKNKLDFVITIKRDEENEDLDVSNDLVEHLEVIKNLFDEKKGTTLKENVRNNLCAYFGIDPTSKNATDYLISTIDTVIESISLLNDINDENMQEANNSSDTDDDFSLCLGI